MVSIREIFLAFEECESTSSLTAKQRALHAVEGPLLAELVLASSDPYVTYGVKVSHQYPELKGGWNDDQIMTLFRTLTGSLATRALTGNAAREGVKSFISALPDELHAKWFTTILNKGRPKGVGRGVLKKVFGKDILPSFGCQAANKYDGHDFSKLMTIDPKIDGLRCIAVCDPNDPQALSRNGRPMPNMVSTVERLIAAGFGGYVVDGEVYAGSWEASMTAAKGSGDVEKNLWAFTAVPLDDFRAGHSPVSEKDRYVILRDGLIETPVDGVVLVPRKIVRDADEVALAMANFLDQGFEGGMLKDPEAPYSTNRSNNWMKVKPEETGDYRIVDIVKGSGRLSQTMGNLVVDVEGVNVGVGTGFSDVDRDFFWQNQEELVGQTVEVAFQNKTPSGSLRFPKFVRLRKDK